jgi:hypothetical protein
MAGVTIVAATRDAEGDFVANTAPGQTLAAYAHYGMGAYLFYSNTRGLPECYKLAIDATADADEFLILLHDAVFYRTFSGSSASLPGTARAAPAPSRSTASALMSNSSSVSTIWIFAGSLDGRVAGWAPPASVLFITAAVISVRRSELQAMHTICKSGDSELAQVHR